jgi:hypothetical protein
MRWVSNYGQNLRGLVQTSTVYCHGVFQVRVTNALTNLAIKASFIGK